MASTITDSVGTSSRTNGMAITSLVLGIVGFFFGSIILGPLAVIFGGIGLNRANHGAKGKGMSIAGVILGIVDIVLFIVVMTAASHNGFSWHI
jgi:hypothetical protein